MDKIFKGWLLTIMMVLLSVSFTACGGDDDDEPSSSTTELKVTNSTGTTLTNLRVVFYNKSGESLGNLGNGDLAAGKSTSYIVPSGTYIYYFLCVDSNGNVRLSPDYYWEDTKFVNITSLSAWYE